MKISEHAAKSDTGRQRHANEDSYFVKPPMFVVADGMGGAQAGEVASKIATEAFEPVAGDGGEGSPEAILEEVVHDANHEIHELAQRDASRAGMGTTLTAAMVHGDDVSLAHVGDSRAYLLRDGELKRLTKDHSLVEELRRQGRLTDEQAEEHPQRSIITRALGPEPSVKVDRMTVSAKPGDVFLLCSDGLTTMVTDAEITQILEDARSMRSAVSRLVAAANREGGRDNITAVAFGLEGAAGGVADEEGATFVSRTAEQAGLTAERMRAAAGKVRPSAAPTPPRRRLRAIILAALAALAILAGLVFGARQLYFLGGDEAGRVAMFRGLPYELPLGIDLYSEQRSIGVQLGSLSPERRRVVTEHKLRSHDDAVDILDDIAGREGSQAPEPADEPAGKSAEQQPANGR